jgi:hypothetical protein
MTRAGSGVWSPMWVDDNRPPPVTLPPITFKHFDAERERKEIAQHIIETRTVKAGIQGRH